MGFVTLFLGMIGLITLWVFFFFPPEYADKRKLAVFNWSCVGFTAMICGAWILNILSIYGGPANQKFFPLVAYGGALGIEAVCMIILFVARNFWIFRASRYGGWSR